MARETKAGRILRKYRDGDKLTDNEVLHGIIVFRKAANALVALGPVFSLAFREANNLYMSLSDIAVVRKLKQPKEE